MKRLSSLLRRDRNYDVPDFSTGFNYLDNILNLKSSSLIFLGARPGMGKSSLALNIASNFVKKSNRCVAYFSLEMSSFNLLNRLLTQITGLTEETYNGKQISIEEQKSLMEGKDLLKKIEMFVDDSSSAIGKIFQKCRVLNEVKEVGLVVIDYLQLINIRDRACFDAEQADILRDLKKLSKELNCTVLILSQLNREVEERDDKRPIVLDLRPLGLIEQICDVVMFLYRDKYYNPDSDVGNGSEIIVAHNRFGSCGKCSQPWNEKHKSFNSVQISRSLEFDHQVQISYSNSEIYTYAKKIIYFPSEFPFSYIHGDAGVGKSFLLKQIAAHSLKYDATKRVKILTITEFIRDLIKAIKENQHDIFKKEYFKSIDLLLIDDFEAIRGKVEKQRQFFEIINAFIQEGGQVVISSCKKMNEILVEGIDLLPHFKRVVEEKFKPIDEELKIAVLKNECHQRNIVLSEISLKKIVKANSCFRGIIGFVIKLEAHKDITKNANLSDDELVDEFLK